MAKIEIGRYSELLRRALGMKGVTEVSGELSPEISPTWQLESDSDEWQFLKGVRIISSSLSIAAVAAQASRLQLVNPAASGVIATVFPVVFTGGITVTLILRMVGTALAVLGTVGTSVPRDNRWNLPAGGASPLILSGEASADAINAGFLVHIGPVPANETFNLPVPIVLTPGSSIQWGSSVDNVAVTGSVHWKERQIPVLER